MFTSRYVFTSDTYQIWKITKDAEDIVYAVDYSHRKERHLPALSLSSAILSRPHLLITDASFTRGQIEKLGVRDKKLFEACLKVCARARVLLLHYLFLHITVRQYDLILTLFRRCVILVMFLFRVTRRDEFWNCCISWTAIGSHSVSVTLSFSGTVFRGTCASLHAVNWSG